MVQNDLVTQAHVRSTYQLLRFPMSAPKSDGILRLDLDPAERTVVEDLNK